MQSLHVVFVQGAPGRVGNQNVHWCPAASPVAGPADQGALTTDRCGQVAAHLVAATADLGAEAAVLVVGRVLLALVGAGAARHGARLDRGAEDAEIRLGVSDEDSAGGIAGIGAVEAEANAADQLLYVGLAEVGVRAAGAHSRAVDALVDTTQKQVAADGE